MRQATRRKATKNAEDLDEAPAAASSVRLLRIPRAAPSIDSYGFHLTRTKWDPYPWVCEVAAGTPAALCGLRPGDCVLEVNGNDVLGLRVADIAKIVKSQEDAVTILCWNSACEKDCDKNSICCAPMPTSLRRLSLALEGILRLVECPVCNITIAPPAMQCQNGHLLCVDCRIRSERCPVCRDFYTPRRALLAEQIHLTIAHAFEMCRSEDKLRQKLFAGITRPAPGQMNSRLAGQDTWRKRKPVLPTNKFLTKLLEGRAYSLDNLSSSKAATLLLCSSSTDILGKESNETMPSVSSISPLTETPPERTDEGRATTAMHPAHDGIAEHLSLSANDLQQAEAVKPAASESAEGVGDEESESERSHNSAACSTASSNASSTASFIYQRPLSDSLLFVGRRRPVNESSREPSPIPPTTPGGGDLGQLEQQQVVQTKPASAALLYRCPCELELELHHLDDQREHQQQQQQKQQEQEQQQLDRHQNCCYKSAFRLL
ncbi:hypothetical protein KR009_006132 [Drosophila setifemur]|nr:hypothetical protein KR009_006132 [Drosophila setifemur]